MLNTPQILPRIFGVHIIDDAIPLQLGIFFQGLAKKLVDQPHLGRFTGFGLVELCFRRTKPLGCVGFFLIAWGSCKPPLKGCNRYYSLG